MNLVAIILGIIIIMLIFILYKYFTTTASALTSSSLVDLSIDQTSNAIKKINSPKTRMSKAEKKLVGRLGKTIIKINNTTLPINTKYKGRSFSVLGIDSLFSIACPCCLKSFNESLNALTMVGNDFIKVIIPPKVTAPAPIYRIYLLHISSGDILLINFTVSGAKGTVNPSPIRVIRGIRTNQERTPPATITPAILGPII